MESSVSPQKSAKSIAQHYLHRLQHDGREAKCTPKILFDHMGLKMDAREATEFYLNLLEKICLESAQQFNSESQSSVLQHGLGIRNLDDLLMCIGTVLYFRKNDATFGPSFSELKNKAQRKVQNSRKHIMARLRFFLMHKQELNFLATANIDHIEGHGSSRIGVVGYSHFVREILFFSLWGNQSFPDYSLLDRIISLINCSSSEWSEFPTNQILHQLIEPVFLGLAPDLSELGTKRGYYLTTSADELKQTLAKSCNGSVYSDPTDPSNIVSIQQESICQSEQQPSDFQQQDPYRLIRQFERQQRCLQRECKLETSSTKKQQLVTRYEANQKLLNRYLFLVDAARASKPLLPVTENILAYSDIITKVLKTAEQVRTNIRYGDSTSKTHEYFRLRFAAQLLSFFRETRYTAKNRPLIVKDLGTLFDPHEDCDTGHALAVFKNLEKEKSTWGGQHDRVLEKIVKQVINSTDTHYVSQQQCTKSIVEQINALKLSNVRFNIKQFDNTASIVGLGSELLRQVRELENDTSILSNNCTTLTQLDLLKHLVLQFLCIDAISSLNFIKDKLQPVLSGFLPNKPWTVSSLRLFEQRIGDFWLKIFDSRQTGSKSLKDEQQDLLNLSVLALELSQMLRTTKGEQYLVDAQKIQPGKIMRFFRQMFAPNGSTGSQNWNRQEWEYLAYHVCFHSNLPAYANIYSRVSASKGIKSAVGLHGLYDSLLQNTNLVAELKQTMDSCLQYDEELQPC